MTMKAGPLAISLCLLIGSYIKSALNTNVQAKGCFKHLGVL